jgi:hypothetical protein
MAVVTMYDTQKVIFPREKRMVPDPWLWPGRIEYHWSQTRPVCRPWAGGNGQNRSHLADWISDK